MNNIAEVMRQYASEVSIASSSFFIWKSINNTAAQQEKVRWALNKNARSWNTLTYSLQVAFFTAIGRIFDRDSRSLTVHRFLSECRAARDQFSKAALERRRIDDARGVRPEYLDTFLKDVYEATERDFAALEDIASKWADVYREKYEPIRHKIIAHKDFATIGSSDALYANTNIGEVQEMLGALHKVERVVWELHANGRLTKLEDHRFEAEKEHLADIEGLLARL